MRTILPAVILAAFAIPAAAQGRGDVQAACFAKNVLAETPGENRIRRRSHDFDKPPKDRPALETRTPIAAGLRGAIRRVDLPPGDKSIALTFDLCEQRGEIAGYDGAIFDVLRREGVKATIFAGGKWMRSHAARTEQLMTDPLFEIANHSDTHRNLRRLSKADMIEEITAPGRDFRSVRNRLAATQCAAGRTGDLAGVQDNLKLFRFPFGACHAPSLSAVNDAGYLAIQWSLSPGDPDPRQGPQAISNAVVKRIKPGDIVILHANGRGWNTAKALPNLITRLKARGYTFATVSELLDRGKPVIAHTCYDARPGDTDRYDFAIRRLAEKKPQSRRSKSKQQ